MPPKLTFVIPVLHPDNATDWPGVKARLAETLASVAAQTIGGWRGVVVANTGSDLPAIPPGFEYVWVDFPPNLHRGTAVTRAVALAALRFDKGRRVLSGLLAVPDSEYFMTVDDDDFVSNRLAAFVSQSDGTSPGWRIDRGYVWAEGSKVLYRYDDFSSACGTSLIVRADLLKLPASVETADRGQIETYFGSHIRIKPILEREGTPLRPLPFAGAIYRVGHSTSVIKTNSPFRRYVADSKLLLRPWRLIGNLLRFAPITPAVRREYFGTVSPPRA
jgi:hypothetical protein